MPRGIVWHHAYNWREAWSWACWAVVALFAEGLVLGRGSSVPVADAAWVFAAALGCGDAGDVAAWWHARGRS